MSINFCTLTGSTLDTFCGNRRQIILDRLLEQKYTPVPATIVGGGNGSIRVGTEKYFPRLVAPPEDDRPTLTFEQPFITVTAELLGKSGQQQLDAQAHMHFVMVSGLQVGAPYLLQDDVSVNISDFTVS